MVSIESHNELLALHRALMELHFVETPNDAAVYGSPLVAAIANRVFEAIIDCEKASGAVDNVEKWKSWRKLDESRREWQVLSRQIRAFKLSTLSAEQRTDFIRALASPFLLSEEQLAQLARV
jgi:hypothetical protein